MVPYTGLDAGQMTVGSELNKLASNIGIGRALSGIHWRQDITQGMLLGEAVAISLLTRPGASLQRELHRLHLHQLQRDQGDDRCRRPPSLPPI